MDVLNVQWTFSFILVVLFSALISVVRYFSCRFGASLVGGFFHKGGGSVGEPGSQFDPAA